MGAVDADRQHRLNALSARLNPDLAASLPGIAVAAQSAVDEHLRRDGTVSRPDTLGAHIVFQLGPVLEHGPQGGWCPRCGASARIGEAGLCEGCAADPD